MDIASALHQFTRTLTKASVTTARLDALVLLEDATGRDRAWLLAHPDYELSDKIATLLHQQIEKRAQHMPLAYIRGKSEFYGREFLVTPDTLQPRAETETMIDLLHQVIDKRLETRDKRLRIVDVGTGSGCIAITAKLEFPTADVYATEINQAALKIAKQNAKNLQAEVKFYQGNLLSPLSPITYNLSPIILANLPYVPNNHTINQASMQEPPIAIFGGPDGLDLYRELFDQISKIATKLQFLLTEALPFQHAALAAIAAAHGYALTDTEDFIQVFRPVQLVT